MPKQKYYVVWKGKKPGVYDSWDACKKQVDGYKDALYKSFDTKVMAQEAYKKSASNYIGKDTKKPALSSGEKKKYGKPIEQSISVDAAWNTMSGKVEYQGVDTKTKKKLFHVGPLDDGTNNVVEFLAIVHALGYCQKKGLTLPIYSDSRNAIKWVKEKDVKTKLEKTSRNKELFDLIIRALVWLKMNTYENKILKWETKAWGENPADFGRK